MSTTIIVMIFSIILMVVWKILIVYNLYKCNRQINRFLKRKKSAIKFQKIHFLEDNNEKKQRRKKHVAGGCAT